jgi:hypothetical protein
MTQDTSNVGKDTTAAESKDDNDGFIVIQTQRYMYNVDKCREKALCGFLLTLVPMPPIDGRAWNAFVIRTTKPTLGIDREENVVEVAEGSDVLIPATHELGQYLMKAALNPKGVFEVRIKAKVKINVGKSREMWTYDIAAKPVPVSRAQFGVAALVGRLPPLLTTGETVSGTGGDDEIPF